MESQKEIIKKLRAYFEKHDEVVMAFLFGSQAARRARKASDWDIAVYLTKEERKVESNIWIEVERIVKAEVDLVMLNRAPAVLAWQILREGEELIIKDYTLYFHFLLQVSEEANAFFKTAHEYYQIFQNSASLSETARGELERFLTFLEGEVQDYKKFRDLTFDDYQHDRAKKRDIEHWVEHLINASVDIAKIVLASERRTMPETYKEILTHLGSVAPFSGELCERMARWVSLRNILTHEYLDVRWAQISAFINETEQLWQEFIKRTKLFLEQK